MAWQLDIHLIDVGQGDCSLIVAIEPVSGELKTMLIDGGEGYGGAFAHAYFSALFNGQPPQLDHMVLTHYNVDHGGGLRAILAADDLDAIVTALTDGAVQAALLGQTRQQILAAVAAAVCSLAMGSTPGQGQQAAGTAIGSVTQHDSDDEAIKAGLNAAFEPPHTVPAMISAPVVQDRIASATAIEAVKNLPGTAAALAVAIRQQLFGRFSGGMPYNAAFETGGCYAGTNVIDLGYRHDRMPGWVDAIEGKFILGGNNTMQAPNLTRSHTELPLISSEVLWGSGAGAGLPPPGAPTATVVSCDGRYWCGPGKPKVIKGAAEDNASSIGLIFRFNNFFYYTAGDLPYQGETPLMRAASTNGLPNPNGGTFPVQPRLSAFKCSHHGADTATSANFLRCGEPTGALISTGRNNQFGHPSLHVVQQLTWAQFVQRLYLTNCTMGYAEIPASVHPNQDQTAVPANKSRVCGDNDVNNMQGGRHRGDIKLSVAEASSTQPRDNGTYRVTYWDNTLAAPAFRSELVTF